LKVLTLVCEVKSSELVLQEFGGKYSQPLDEPEIVDLAKTTKDGSYAILPKTLTLRSVLRLHSQTSQCLGFEERGLYEVLLPG
jgi:hypothetical protein